MTQRDTARRVREPQLETELATAKGEIEEYARSYGLDFFEVIFEVLEFDDLNMVSAYGGFPTRYPHWRHGMVYEQLSKGYQYGLQKIYELVINNDPTYAYLLRSNSLVEQKLVMAHVFGHADFFKNNIWFSRTNRKMIDEMANHGTRVRRYIDRYGLQRVEEFIDQCLSLENLIDPHAPFVLRQREAAPPGEEVLPPAVRRLRSKDYMDRYINPPEALVAQREKAEQALKAGERVPESPVKDVLAFLIEHAPLKDWQTDILGMIREEAYYFAPQAMTKIMNEGWASYWHSRMMTEKILTARELIDYADVHSRTLASSPGQLNPYKLGVELFRDIEDRWNRGAFGKEYEECDDMARRARWDRKTGLGPQKIFEVRRIYNDVQFLDAFLTEDFCRRQKLFTYRHDPQTGSYVVDSREFASIKAGLLAQMTNLGQPVIHVVDANHENRGELFLLHRHTGVDLKPGFARETLKNLAALWGRPVLLRTVEQERPRLVRFDGREFQETSPEGEA